MNGHTALVTGASSGIGLELARILAAEGHDLVLVARRREQLEEIARDLETQYAIHVRVISADLADQRAVESVVQQLKAAKVEIDILINNAGFGDYGPFAQSDRAKQLGMIDVNVRALTELTHHLLPGMVARKRGRILNVASTAAFQPGPLMAVYYATKAYVLSFSEAIAEEVRGTGVTVTTLCPGPTQSEFQSSSRMEESRLVADRKLPTAAEVAQFGYRALLAGRPIAIHGWLNTLIPFAIRFLPRAWVVRAVAQAQARTQRS
ncbi:SDR family oxidoreductase [Candidatus Berkelbacteria bacterium]|nr:SDR family oxidoreductase [Candidatus Berkelbacteria bacterium]